MITTEITLDALTKNSVSVKTQKYYDGTPLGEPHRKAYENSIAGRAQIMQELAAEHTAAVLSVWGETPTINRESEV